jgi:hypothetical protein
MISPLDSAGAGFEQDVPGRAEAGKPSTSMFLDPPAPPTAPPDNASSAPGPRVAFASPFDQSALTRNGPTDEASSLLSRPAVPPPVVPASRRRARPVSQVTFSNPFGLDSTPEDYLLTPSTAYFDKDATVKPAEANSLVQRGFWTQTLFRYSYYAAVLITVYLVLIGLSLWKGAVYHIWYAASSFFFRA